MTRPLSTRRDHSNQPRVAACFSPQPGSARLGSGRHWLARAKPEAKATVITIPPASETWRNSA